MMITESLYTEYKPLMLSIAYRMTGSLVEAEDIVQDTFLRLTEDTPSVQSMKAYLVKTVTNRSINVLKSSRKTRETYPGPWLPEPFIQQVNDDDPAEHLLLKEEISYALLVLLDELTPDERAVFILRESFGFTYKETARVLRKTEANCRKLLSRAKSKISDRLPADAPKDNRAEAWMQQFISAAQSGQLTELVRFMREDAVLLTDGGGKIRAALNPIFSRAKIMAFFSGITAKGALRGQIVPVLINGEPGLVLYDHGLPKQVLAVEWDANQHIKRIFGILNPDKIHVTPLSK